MDPLTDLIPPKARKWVYAAVAVASTGWGAWEASQGDWKAFAGSMLGAAVSALARANVNAPADGGDPQP